MVKFAKNGSDATTAAVKLARAATGRQLVAVCRTQPFFSTDDWFIGTTAMHAGISGRAAPADPGFRVQRPGIRPEHARRTPRAGGCLILEAATATGEPEPGFLEGLRDLADRDGFVLVFDEMITACAGPAGGAQGLYGIMPDLSTWGKALGNGFPMSALAGKRELMELGGLRTDAVADLLLSTTHGPETTGLAAYQAVADAYRRAGCRGGDGDSRGASSPRP